MSEYRTEKGQRPAWWPTAEAKRHADAGCAHPDECRIEKTPDEISNSQSRQAKKAHLAEVMAAHRFVPDRSTDGTLNYGWCAGGDSYGTKHISEHEAHVLDVAFPPAESYRPCSGCDSVGASCRAVGCPATKRVIPPGSDGGA